MVVAEAMGGGVIGVEVEEEFFGVEFAEDGALVSAGLGVPLGRGAASGEEGEREGAARRLGEWRGWIEEELCAAGGGVEFVVFEETTFFGAR